MKRTRQAQGMTLIEVLLAMALTALLGITLASSVNLWLGAREELARATPLVSQVRSLCDGLERSFDSLVLRQLHENRLPLPVQTLDWQPGEGRLEWVALDGVPLAGGEQASRLRRQRLSWSPASRRLMLASSMDLDALGAAVWRDRLWLDEVQSLQLTFFGNGRWQSQPAAFGSAGVRLDLQVRDAPFVCTFVLPEVI